jgi:type II secretory pathway component PulK
VRKPKDFDSELRDLNERTRLLKEKRIRQLGELMAATGADALGAEILAGVLLEAIESDQAKRQGWRARGAAFFQ